jgi:hypothetical protein
MPSAKIPDALRRVFLEAFTARDIAEPLASFDAGAPSAEVREFMQTCDFDVVGVRLEGRVSAYATRGALSDGDCGQYALRLEDAVVLPDSTPLLKVVLELDRTPFLLVQLLGSVGGIVTRADLQKPPVRMWLFGMVTLIEMRFTELIERHSPADAWMGKLSEARLQKASDLLAERRRCNQSVRLIDCLQLADKGQIVARDAAIREDTIFSSRRQAEEASRMVERLRNNLAHAQDIVSSDWETIVMLGEFVTQQFGSTKC